MQAFCTNVALTTFRAGLPVSLPLKAAIGGVELLVDRAQLWEQSAAKHVSIAAQLDLLLAQARRWRKLELASWRSLLSQARKAHALSKAPPPYL